MSGFSTTRVGNRGQRRAEFKLNFAQQCQLRVRDRLPEVRQVPAARLRQRRQHLPVRVPTKAVLMPDPEGDHHSQPWTLQR